ncbi:MAG: hypothetical protein IKO78_01715 [Bacilli bacterium]|nr:hypothetical protein [Bacilli bacterium]
MALEDDDEDWYFYPWLDPKNDGKKFTKEEIIAAFPRADGIGYGVGETVDGAIEELKAQGRYEYSEKEYLDMIDEKLDHAKTRVLEHEVSPYDMDGKVLDRLDTISDDELDEVIENDLMPVFINKLEDIRTCFDEFNSLRRDCLDVLCGSYASVNKEVFGTVSEDMNVLYKYMMESTLPAIDKIVELKETIEELHKKEKELEELLPKIEEKEKHIPYNDYEYVTSESEYQYNWNTLQYERLPNGGIIKMYKQSYYKYLEELDRMRKAAEELREDIKKIKEKEREIIKDIKNFEELRLVFTDIVE